MEPLSFEASSILGWLFTSTIYTSILICLILAIKAATGRKLPAWWSYGLWLLLVFRMLIPWGVESRVSIFNYVPTPPANESYMPFLMEREIYIPLLSHDIETVSSTDIDLNNSSADERNDIKEPNGPASNLSLDKLIVIIWFAGVLFFGITTLFKNLKFWVTIRREPPVNNKAVIDVLESFRSSLVIRKKVAVIVTDKVKSPALFGYFKPRLLLPPRLIDMLEKDELRCIFLHELGHLKRHDIGVSWLAAVLQSIHWFNPLVWYAFHCMRVDQEAACDAYVLLKIKQVHPADYANTIIDLLERLVQNRRLPSLAGIIENKSQIRRRIAMIINYKRYSLKTTLVLFLMLLAVGLVFFTGSSGKANAKKSEIAVDDKEIQFIKPIDGEVSSGYEERIAPSSNEKKSPEAIDFAIPEGPAQSPAIEKVVRVSLTRTTTQKVNNQKEPLKLAWNEIKVGSFESKAPERDTETSEAVEQQNPPVGYTARGMSDLKKGQIDTDGLTVIKSARNSETQIKDGVDWSGYTKFQISPVEVSFRKNWKRDYNRDQRSLSEQVTDKDMDKIKKSMGKIVYEEFDKRLQKNGGLTKAGDQADSNTLLFKPTIIDLDVYAPDIQNSPVISKTYIRQAGRATLFLEVHDAVSGTILARWVDTMEDPDDGYYELANQITNTYRARRVVGIWARRFVKELDHLKAVD